MDKGIMHGANCDKMKQAGERGSPNRLLSASCVHWTYDARPWNPPYDWLVARAKLARKPQ